MPYKSEKMLLILTETSNFVQFHISQMDTHKIFGLIGYPLGHSFSCGFFNDKFAAEGIDARYINFEIPSVTELKEVLDDHPGLSGLNVTIPYKEKVIP